MTARQTFIATFVRRYAHDAAYLLDRTRSLRELILEMKLSEAAARPTRRPIGARFDRLVADIRRTLARKVKS